MCLLIQVLLQTVYTVRNRSVHTSFLKSSQTSQHAVNDDDLLFLHLVYLFVLFGLPDHEPVDRKDCAEDYDEGRED